MIVHRIAVADIHLPAERIVEWHVHDECQRGRKENDAAIIYIDDSIIAVAIEIERTCPGAVVADGQRTGQDAENRTWSARDKQASGVFHRLASRCGVDQADGAVAPGIAVGIDLEQSTFQFHDAARGRPCLA